jgi:hypothetical protein
MRLPSGEKRGVEARPETVAIVFTALASATASVVTWLASSRETKASAPSAAKVSPE